VIKCRKCKQFFSSEVAYGIHTWMIEKVGRKRVCPSVDQLEQQGMSLYHGQWLFLSDKMKAELEEQ
jgi:hypothetical protein